MPSGGIGVVIIPLTGQLKSYVSTLALVHPISVVDLYSNVHCTKLIPPPRKKMMH